MDSQATIRAPRGGQGLDQKELTAMPRWFNDNWDFGGRPDPTEDGTREPKSRKRRLATTFVFTVLFFAGASLAAVAGDRLTASIPSDDAAAIAADTTTTDAAPDAAAPAAAATAAAASHDLSPPADSAAATPDPTAVASEAAAAASDQGFSMVSGSDSSSTAPDASAPGASAAHSPRQTAAKRARTRTEHLRAVLLPKTKPAPKPEIEGPQSAATVWLNSLLPDPTPPALRLSARFASNLKSAARNGGVNWATMLGILRARGASGHSPADRVT